MNISNSARFGAQRPLKDLQQPAAAPQASESKDEWVKNWDSNDVWWTRKQPSTGGPGGGCG